MTISGNISTEDRAAREVWAALPIEEAYPVGSEWHHMSYGSEVFTVVSHGMDGRTVHVTSPRIASGDLGGSWPRTSLDSYGTPKGTLYGQDTPTPSTEPTEPPYEPTTVGERVRVTALPDRERWAASIPDSLLGRIGEYRNTDTYDAERHYFVTFDDGSGYWVKDVTRAPEEVVVDLDAIEREVEAGAPQTLTQYEVDALVRAAKREGRAEASREFEAWKLSAQETAHQYAQDNALCSEFDRCMLAIGLEPRDSFEVEYDVTVEYTFTMSVPGNSDVKECALEYVRENAPYLSPDVNYEEA